MCIVRMNDPQMNERIVYRPSWASYLGSLTLVGIGYVISLGVLFHALLMLAGSGSIAGIITDLVFLIVMVSGTTLILAQALTRRLVVSPQGLEYRDWGTVFFSEWQYVSGVELRFIRRYFLSEIRLSQPAQRLRGWGWLNPKPLRYFNISGFESQVLKGELGIALRKYRPEIYIDD